VCEAATATSSQSRFSASQEEKLPGQNSRTALPAKAKKKNTNVMRAVARNNTWMTVSGMVQIVGQLRAQGRGHGSSGGACFAGPIAEEFNFTAGIAGFTRGLKDDLLTTAEVRADEAPGLKTAARNGNHQSFGGGSRQ
jgi:hypothetical protein